jgi:hypothetical protein
VPVRADFHPASEHQLDVACAELPGQKDSEHRGRPGPPVDGIKGLSRLGIYGSTGSIAVKGDLDR